jgi:deazaflavin-dependent oxidoreductase (nitroreductase family)
MAARAWMLCHGPAPCCREAMAIRRSLGPPEIPKPSVAHLGPSTSVGRRTGEERVAILGYLEDGPNLILLAMNGRAEPDPAWSLDLQANPHARVDLVGGSREVSGRIAEGPERARLWARWVGSARAPMPTSKSEPPRAYSAERQGGRDRGLSSAALRYGRP